MNYSVKILKCRIILSFDTCLQLTNQHPSQDIKYIYFLMPCEDFLTVVWLYLFSKSCKCNLYIRILIRLLMAESEEELKRLLMRMKEESEKAGLKLYIK